MKTKIKTFENTENKPLCEVWENEIVISKNTIDMLKKVFKEEGLKKGSDCIILQSNRDMTTYRTVGEQQKYKMILRDTTK